MIRVARGMLVFVVVVGMALSGAADEFTVVDLDDLNRRIGLDYEQSLTTADLLPVTVQADLLLYGEVHDQERAARQFVGLLQAVGDASGRRIRIGIEFVDRGDGDILQAYLQSTLSEEAFLERVMLNSLLRSPESGEAHMSVLRYARRHELDVVPLESRPSGARSATLRSAEIRWNLSQELARHPEALHAVLYGVDHVLGADPIHEGLDVQPLIITTYGDSVQASFRWRAGRDPYPGEVLRLRDGVYLQSVGGPPGVPRLMGMDFGGNEDLLLSIENIYSGSRDDLAGLIAALMHDDVRWRRAAAHALQFIAEDALGYDAEAPDRMRRQAQRRWVDWLEGRAEPTPAEDERRGGAR
jgi:hypothetical protein